MLFYEKCFHPLADCVILGGSCLFVKYIDGIKKPSEQRKMQIKQTLHTLGEELLGV